jgi:hypothetical protein
MIRKWRKKQSYVASYIRDEMDDDGNLIPIYDKPEDLGLLNVQPLSGTTDSETYGARVRKMQKILFDYDNYLYHFKENDVFYVDGASPEGENANGDNANYKVDSVRNQNKLIAVYIEKLPNEPQSEEQQEEVIEDGEEI